MAFYKRNVAVVAKEEDAPKGQLVEPPMNLCNRDLPRAMYPVVVQLCWYCSQNNAAKCYQFNSGRISFNLQMCPRCVEYNTAVQSVGYEVLKRQKEEIERAKNIN